MPQNEREFRSFELMKRSEESEGLEYVVEGYASTFEPYVMYRDAETGIDFSEQIARNAFDNADFSDCVFRVDHEGAVYARTSAGTITLDVDDGGLHTVTDLSRTARARALHEDIVAGNYPQMSFAFTVEEDHYDRKTHTRVIDRINKVFDIAAVTWPANPTTSLSARSKDFFDGAIEEERAERLAEERRTKALERFNKLIKKEIAENDN